MKWEGGRMKDEGVGQGTLGGGAALLPIWHWVANDWVARLAKHDWLANWSKCL